MVQSHISFLFQDISRLGPQTFSDFEEVKGLFLKSTGAEKNKLREQLIHKCLLLACSYAKSYAYKYHMQFEDLIGPAFEGLIYGVDHLSDFPGIITVVRYIKNQCNLFINCQSGEFRTGRTSSAPHVLPESLDDTQGYSDPLYTRVDGNYTDPSDIPVSVAEVVDNLPDHYKDVFTQRYALGYFTPKSVYSLARDYNVSHQRIQQILSKSKDILKSKISEYELCA